MMFFTPEKIIANYDRVSKNGKDLKINEDVKVLVLMSHAYGTNTHLYFDNFEQYGWDITTAALTQTVQPCNFGSSSGCLPITVDLLISEVSDISEYDVLVIAPATWDQSNVDPYIDLIENQDAINLVVSAVNENLIIYTHCAGARVLAAANVINGVNIQAKPGDNGVFLTEYNAAGANYLGDQIPPVIDGIFVTTSRGLYFHYQNCQAIATALENNQ
jgi:putative intracellular protease/amidase